MEAVTGMSLPADAQSVCAVRVTNAAETCSILWRDRDDEFVLSIVRGLTTDSVEVATFETVIRPTAGAEFAALTSFSSNNMHCCVVAFVFPHSTAADAKDVHFFLLQQNGDGSAQLRQHLPINTAVHGPVVAYSMRGDVMHLTTRAVAFILRITPAESGPPMTLLQTLQLVRASGL